jgi:hypothetical protein
MRSFVKLTQQEFTVTSVKMVTWKNERGALEYFSLALITLIVSIL